MDDRLQPILAEILRLREQQRERLPGNSNGSTPGGVTDDWKESVDRQLGQLHDDFRQLVGWLIAAIAAPLLAIVGLYVYTGQKADELEVRLRSIETQQARMDQRLVDALAEKQKPISVGK